MRFLRYLKDQKEYKIYVDMDGVLTDFNGQFFKYFKRTPEEVHKEGGDPLFWGMVSKGGLEFWSKMPWLGGSKQFWNYVKQFNPTILSAPARSLPQSPKGKKMWVKRELGNVPLILKRAREKKEYADENSVLIDDSQENINGWRSAGGVGILFKSPQQALRDLKGVLESELKDFLSHKDHPKLGKGSQYLLVGRAGKMGLYQSKTYSGTTRGSSNWAVDFGGMNIVTFADKPSIPDLIKKHYPVPEGSPKKWKKVSI